MKFLEKLQAAWERSGSLLCVGLDPDTAKFPACLKSAEKPVFAFNQAVIDATADLVCAYKPQIAYYEGLQRMDELVMTLEYLRTKYPQIPVILDAKRADIGSTSGMYAKAAFDVLQADAVTVNPYMGMDALKPFLDRADKGVVILCRTSNPGAAEIQDVRMADGQELFKHVARLASGPWNYNGNVMLVTGATFPEQLSQVRSIVGDVPLLVPGIGAQGGDVAQVLKHGLDSRGTGLVINSSRGILYASNGDDFAQAARQAALKLNAVIAENRGR